MHIKATSLPNLKLTVDQVKLIDSMVQQVKSISLLGSQVVSTLVNNVILFGQTLSFIASLEGVFDKTYYDPNGILSIGIGFNLQQPGASDVIKSLGLDYSQLMQGEGEPPDGISNDQIAALFKVTLLGSQVVPSWTGKAQQLQTILIANGFGNTVFRGPEIIALQSLAYQEGNKLFGQGFITALRFYKQYGDPLSLVSQIVECSNKGRSVGISNRRLCEAALIAHMAQVKKDGEELTPDMIVLPYRQQQYILAANHLSQPPTSEPLAIKGYHLATYQGTEQVREVPGCDAADQDKIILGSKYADTLSVPAGGSPVVLGGAGDDVLIAPPAVSDMNDGNATFPYYAGNDGTNTYQAALMPGQIKIYDVNRQGKVFHDGNEVSGMSIGGILKTLARDFTLAVQAVEDDVQMALDWAMPGHSITVGNVDVVKGTVGILPRNLQQLNFSLTDALDYSISGVLVKEGLYVNIHMLEWQTPVLKANVNAYDFSGALVWQKLFQLPWPSVCGPETQSPSAGSGLIPVNGGYEIVTGFSCYVGSELRQFLYIDTTPVLTCIHQNIFAGLCKPSPDEDYQYLYFCLTSPVPDICPNTVWSEVGLFLNASYPIRALDNAIVTGTIVRQAWTYRLAFVYGVNIDNGLKISYQESVSKDGIIPPIKLDNGAIAVGSLLIEQLFPPSTLINIELLMPESPEVLLSQDLSNTDDDDTFYDCEEHPEWEDCIRKAEALKQAELRESAAQPLLQVNPRRRLLSIEEPVAWIERSENPGTVVPKPSSLDYRFAQSRLPQAQTSLASRLELPTYIYFISRTIHYAQQLVGRTARSQSDKMDPPSVDFARARGNDRPIWTCQFFSSDEVGCVDESGAHVRRYTKHDSAATWEAVLTKSERYPCEVTAEDGRIKIKHCADAEGKAEYVEYEQTPDSASLHPGYELAHHATMSAATGAVYTAAPEVLGDVLEVTGVVTQKNAQRIKQAAQAVLILATGSYVATAASQGTRIATRWLGFSERTASIAGSTAAIAVNAAKSFTPMGLATTAVSTVAGAAGSRVGFWLAGQLKRTLQAQVQKQAALMRCL